MFRYPLGPQAELRLLEMQHAEGLFALIDQNRTHLRRWLTWVDNNRAVADSRSFIRSALQQFADNRGFAAGIWYRGALAGMIGYNDIDWFDSKAELGYWLGEQFQGHGLMTLACRALTSHSFHDLHLNRVEILCAEGNSRSRAVPERLGFTQEGIMRQAEWLHDHFVDLVIYAVLASEWQQPRH